MTFRVLMGKWEQSVVQTFLDLGLEIVLVLDDFDVKVSQPDPVMLDRCALVYRISSFDSHEEVAAIAGDLLSRRISPDLVFAHTEFSQLGVGYIELLLGKQNAVRRHAMLRDKRLMKAAVAQAGVPVTQWRSLADPTDAATVDRVRSELAFPVVVKPAFGVGTMSTLRVETADEFGAALFQLRYEAVLRSRQLIVEEFVPGRELHVDALWLDGEPRFFLISAYHESRLDIIRSTGRTIQLDGSYVIPMSEASGLYERLSKHHRSVNDALEIVDAVTHTEFFERPDGSLVFSETAARLGGGWIPSVLSEFLGDNVWTVVARALVSGETPIWPAPTTYIGGLNLRPAKPGRITHMPNPVAVRNMPSVRTYQSVLTVGDEVTQRLAAEWSAIAVLEAKTERSYVEAAVNLVTRHPVITER